MSDAHNKLQLREYVTTETLNFVLDLNYYFFLTITRHTYLNTKP